MCAEKPEGVVDRGREIRTIVVGNPTGSTGIKVV